MNMMVSFAKTSVTRDGQVAYRPPVVIYAGTGYHLTAPKALITGLGKRREQTGKDTYYIHV